MSELEVLAFFAEEDVIDGGRAVRRRQDVPGVSVAKEVDLLLLKKTKSFKKTLDLLRSRRNIVSAKIILNKTLD